MIRIILPWLYLRVHPLATGWLHRVRLMALAMLWLMLVAIFHRPLKNFYAPQATSSRMSFLAWRALVAAPARFAAP